MMIYFIFAAFLAGFLLSIICKRLNFFKVAINEYLIWIGFPLLVYTSLEKLDIGFNKFLLAGALYYIISNIIVYKLIGLTNFPDKKKSSLLLSAVYSNTAYVGIPIAFSLFGVIGASLMAVLTVISAALHYSIGIYFSNKYIGRGGSEYAILEVIKFPLFWGLIVATLLAKLINYNPDWLISFSKLPVYLSPFLIGMTLHIKNIDSLYLWGFFLRFFASPLIALIILAIFPLDTNERLIILLASLLPSALANTSLAIKFKFDEEFTSGFASFSTAIFLAGLTFLKLLKFY